MLKNAARMGRGLRRLLEGSGWYLPEDDSKRDIASEVARLESSTEMLERAWSAVHTDLHGLRIADLGPIRFDFVENMANKYYGLVKLVPKNLRKHGGYQVWDTVATILKAAEQECTGERAGQQELVREALEALDLDFQDKCMKEIHLYSSSDDMSDDMSENASNCD